MDFITNINKANIEIEKAVIIDILYYGNEEKEIVNQFTENDFILSGARKVYKVVKDFIKQDKDFDISIIIDGLTKMELSLEEREEIQYFVSNAPISKGLFEEHIERFINIIEQRAVNKVLENKDNKTAEELKQELEDIANKKKTNIENENKKFWENYRVLKETPKEHIKTYYGSIDKRLIGGFEKGTLAVIGARPRVGKTAFACNMIKSQVLSGDKKVMFFTLEMTKEQIADRLIATIQSIEYNKFLEGNFDAQSQEKLEQFYRYTKAIDITNKLFLSEDIRNIEDICYEIKRTLPDIVYIDYAQIIDTKEKFNGKREKIDYIIDKLKAVAIKTKAVVVLLAQLNRTADNGAVTLSDLKESGHLEEAGDYILLLDRELDTTTNKLNEKTILSIAKNKFGLCGAIGLYFDGERQRFTEILQEV